MRGLRTRGDTIVEVMVAFAVMSLVILAVSTLMGMGLNIAQRSLETSLVRQQIDAQADLLRYAQDQNGAVWNTVIKSTYIMTADPISTDAIVSSDCSVAPSDSFVLYFDTTTNSIGVHSTTSSSYYQQPVAYSSVSDAGVSQGMWIQAVRADGSSNVRAYDFYIRSCWHSSGSADEPVTIGTIVRLYDK